GVVHLPADALGVEVLEDRLLAVVVGGIRRDVIGDVAERRARQRVEAVRERLGQDRVEVRVARGEGVVEAVVEGQVGLVVVPHGAAARGVGGVLIGLGEAVHGPVVVLGVAAVPAVVEVGRLAVAGLVVG